ncbi:WGR domain [Dillenia turbinata]|uniref:Poly [ADP-ribose] polymerase n=1 Tax=Dillenia turbinata TaxID=194707 RepID=A0AAN8W3T9_9MAGN
MADKLKIVELRKELARRGLDTTGTKPALVKRLGIALNEEGKLSKDSFGGQKKRKRESEAKDLSGSEKILATAKPYDMNIHQLRKEANLQGIDTNRSKKELLERLCNDSETALKDQGSDDIHEDQDDEKKNDDLNEKENKQSTTISNAVLDQYLPDNIKSQYLVLQHKNEIYDAMLNQTNVGDNNNKFYVIQVLEANDGGKFMVYTRWGRVGIKGQDKIQGPYNSRDVAVREFEEKFFAKTKNHWSERKAFICFPKCYTWLEMDHSDAKDEKEAVVEEKPASSIERELLITKLDSRVAKFISMIWNISMMKQQMMSLGFNPNKLPLGKLSKSTILKGYDVLKRIADVIDQSDKKKLEQLSGEFYSIIPHDFGFRKMREFVIDNHYKLKTKLEMVEALGEIELATSLIKDEKYSREDPLLSHYQCLRCELTPLEVDSEELSMIEKYIQTQNQKDILKLKLSRFLGLPEKEKAKGLRIAPPEAPACGYSFGKGVYFADVFSKRAGFCLANSVNRDAVLVLCEVALGDMAELIHSNFHADKLPVGKLSTKGLGRVVPDMSEAQILEDGVIVPLGKPEEQGQGPVLYHNEYIVYSVDQIRISPQLVLVTLVCFPTLQDAEFLKKQRKLHAN